MEIVVLDDKLRVRQPKQPVDGVRGTAVNTQATMAEQLGEDDKLMAVPPFVEAHRETHDLETNISEKRNADHVDDLLLVVGVQGKERVGVLCQMVGSVVTPEPVSGVHDSMVPIKPKIQDYAVEAELDGQGKEVDGQGCLVGSVGKEDSKKRTNGGGHGEGHDDLRDSAVRNLIPGMLVAVEEAIPHSEAFDYIQLLNGNCVVGDHVEKEGGHRVEVAAEDIIVQLLDGERCGGIHKDPDLQVPVGNGRQLFRLLVDGRDLVDDAGLDAEDFVEMVEEAPVGFVRAPGRLHRITRILRRRHGGDFDLAGRCEAHGCGDLLQSSRRWCLEERGGRRGGKDRLFIKSDSRVAAVVECDAVRSPTADHHLIAGKKDLGAPMCLYRARHHSSLYN